jgi:hypothetical protein
MHLITRLIFRGIYFPQMGKRAWVKLAFDNRRSIHKLVREGFGKLRRVEPAQTVAGVPIPES